MSFALTIDHLQKRFRRTVALRGIQLAVPRGTVYGLVGVNGAGKTTTIECALGLLRPDGGRIIILGFPPAKIARSAGRVGAVFDTPLLPSNLTVRQTLEHGRIACGRDGRTPAEVETLLGIEYLSRRKTRHLSHGNRRRLSIALSLLGRPELLVLDEPFSGLDAAGVEDVLALLARLNRDEGMTILLSSHQLHHVETISTNLCIIHEGSTVAQGSLDDLLEGARPRLSLRVDDPERARSLLSPIPGVQEVRLLHGGQIEVELAGADLPGAGPDSAGPAAINTKLVKAGLAVSELVIRRPSLHAYFQKSIGRKG